MRLEKFTAPSESNSPISALNSANPTLTGTAASTQQAINPIQSKTTTTTTTTTSTLSSTNQNSFPLFFLNPRKRKAIDFKANVNNKAKSVNSTIENPSKRLKPSMPDQLNKLPTLLELGLWNQHGAFKGPVGVEQETFSKILPPLTHTDERTGSPLNPCQQIPHELDDSSQKAILLADYNQSSRRPL